MFISYSEYMPAVDYHYYREFKKIDFVIKYGVKNASF